MNQESREEHVTNDEAGGSAMRKRNSGMLGAVESVTLGSQLSKREKEDLFAPFWPPIRLLVKIDHCDEAALPNYSIE
jgi:hypothetical protein